jgi:hypothetical protein
VIRCFTGPTAATEPGGGPPVLWWCYRQGSCFLFTPAYQGVPARDSRVWPAAGALSVARLGAAVWENSVLVTRWWFLIPVMTGTGVPSAPGHGCPPGGPPEMTLYDPGCPGTRYPGVVIRVCGHVP